MAQGHDNIEIRGFVEDIESLVATATAVVYAPKQEDFGMVGAEAMMAGKPLLGVNEGFTRYQINPGITGEYFQPTADSVRETIQSFNSNRYDQRDIQSAAHRYSYEEFTNGINRVIAEGTN
jgi:glycosyltransferase involved in cell wall biosynthesis